MTSLQTVKLSELREVWESWHGWYWFITEYHEGTLAFGLVKGWETEWGYVDLAELQQLKRGSRVWRVPKQNWAFCPCVIDDAAFYSRGPRVLWSQFPVILWSLPPREPQGGGNMKEGFETSCCGQEMRAHGEVDFVNPAVRQVRRWLCSRCGRRIDLVDFVLDEGELDNMLRFYGTAEETASLHILRGGQPGHEPGSADLQARLKKQVGAGWHRRPSVRGTVPQRVARTRGAEGTACELKFMIRTERRWLDHD